MATPEFTAAITVERTDTEVTFRATAFNGGAVTVRQGDQDGLYEQFILLLGGLVDAAKGQIEVSA